MAVTLDMMEYATDAAAKAAYVESAIVGGGSELVTNGLDWTGAAGTTPPNGWTNANPGHNDTYDIDAGALKMTTVDSQAMLEQILTLVSGTKYILSVDLKNNNLGNGVMVRLGTTPIGSEYGSEIETGGNWVTHSFIFTATQANAYLTLYNGATAGNQWGWYDTCSIKAIALQAYSEDTIKEQGDYSLKGIALLTSSLNETLTRTVDPTINLSDLTQNKLGIYASRTGSNIKISIRDSGSATTEITPNIIDANTWQTVEWDISAVSNANKDAIDRIIITIVNADSDNIFYLDNMFGGWPVLTFTEDLALLESLPGLDRALSPLEESLALLEDLTQYARGLSLEESIALKEEETASISSLLTESLALKESETADIHSVLTESLALKEDLTQLGHALTLEESLALLEEAHAETLLFEVDKDGNITYMGTLDGGAF